MIQVTAGILWHARKILICRRTAAQAHPLQWEFPGGKLEAEETPAQALVRELREELGIDAAPGQELMRYEFAYPGKDPLLLIFIDVREWRGEPENRIFEEMRWEYPDALPQFDFLEGDRLFLGTLICPEPKTELPAIR